MDYQIQTNDITYNMMLRTCYFYFFILGNVVYLYFNNIFSNNFGDNFVSNYNYLTITSLNAMHFVIFFLSIIEITHYTFIKIVIFLMDLTSFILRITTIILNSTVLFDSEFHFFTFYLWYFVLIINIYCSFLLNKPKIKKKSFLIPGKYINENSLCSICLENNCNWQLPCQHKFHYDCINRWFLINKTCPYCRRSLNT